MAARCVGVFREVGPPAEPSPAAPASSVQVVAVLGGGRGGAVNPEMIVRAPPPHEADAIATLAIAMVTFSVLTVVVIAEALTSSHLPRIAKEY